MNEKVRKYAERLMMDGMEEDSCTRWVDSMTLLLNVGH